MNEHFLKTESKKFNYRKKFLELGSYDIICCNISTLQVRTSAFFAASATSLHFRVYGKYKSVIKCGRCGNPLDVLSFIRVPFKGNACVFQRLPVKDGPTGPFLFRVHASY